jgi:hypothetical protein
MGAASEATGLLIGRLGLNRADSNGHHVCRGRPLPKTSHTVLGAV